MSNSSILHIDGALTGTLTPDQSGPGSNRNERLSFIAQATKLEPPYQMVKCHTQDTCSRRVVSYFSSEMQSAYSAALVEWTIYFFLFYIANIKHINCDFLNFYFQVSAEDSIDEIISSAANSSKSFVELFSH